MPADTKKQQRFMCAVCGGKITRKKGKLPSKSMACEFCKQGVSRVERKALSDRRRSRE